MRRHVAHQYAENPHVLLVLEIPSGSPLELVAPRRVLHGPVRKVENQLIPDTHVIAQVFQLLLQPRATVDRSGRILRFMGGLDLAKGETICCVLRLKANQIGAGQA